MIMKELFSFQEQLRTLKSTFSMFHQYFTNAFNTKTFTTIDKYFKLSPEQKIDHPMVSLNSKILFISFYPLSVMKTSIYLILYSIYCKSTNKDFALNQTTRSGYLRSYFLNKKRFCLKTNHT